ncbi:MULTISPECIES: hypothetical protein [Streptomyces]|uniref:hypothetical protein n=1 Tax=Streptomyces TaxID=1883 RepID=UPI001811C0E5|nr:hypothetical protein [Streptomyces murinus]MBA9050763.1 hypothetical protein [Streptomyces murinus]
MGQLGVRKAGGRPAGHLSEGDFLVRLRHSVAAALGALALIVTVPTSSHAAVGEFEYQTGQPPVGTPRGLTDPASNVCINLTGATEEQPAFSPKNLTASTATIFLDFDCGGDIFYVMNPGRILGNRVKVRSVVFS